MRIALLEDDILQAELVKRWLADAGIECVHFTTGAEFRHGILQSAYDLVLLDWMLPDDDGVAVLIWLRQAVSAKLPVMFTTTRSEEGSLVYALEKGADDYLIKPLRREEMIARIHALMRRGETASPHAPISVGGILIDRSTHRVTVEGEAVELTDKELELAIYVLTNQGRLLSRQELLEHVWRTNPNVITRTVDTHISRLRTKLGLTPERGFELSTVYHKGYRLEYIAGRNTAPSSGRSPYNKDTGA